MKGRKKKVALLAVVVSLVLNSGTMSTPVFATSAATNTTAEIAAEEEERADTVISSASEEEDSATAVTDSMADIPADGWNDDRTSYYKDGMAVTGFQQIDADTYFFDQDGIKAADKYIADDGEEVTDEAQFAEESGIYYFDSDGKRVENNWTRGTGTKFADSDGKIIKSAWNKINSNWYYFDQYGSTRTGWLKLQNNWYYLNADGVMATGWKKVGSSWYYLNGSGAMATGWKKVGGKWYYLNGSGAMATGWKKVSGKWYYLNGSGAMATGWKKVSGKWYYLNSGGDMATGWKKIGGTWYYLNGSGEMVTGTVEIGGKTYTFNNSGAWQDASAKRQKVVSYMRAMATVKWKPSTTMTYWSSTARKWVKGTTYSGIPYSQYSRTTTLEQFKSYLSGSTYTGPSGRTTYKGTDCSSSVSLAWMRVNSSFGIRWTGTLTPGNGGISKVGDYVGNISNTKSSCSSTGRNKMYAAYKKLQPGDAVVSHGSNYHVRMVVSVSSGGVTCIEQSGLVMANRSSWKVNQYYSFASLYNNGYVPVTMSKW